jgi:TolB-like protein/tetratricopeptide (TPR) repeat protein
MESVWQRLRSRKIVEWVVGYLAGAFGLLQIADVLEGAFSWPASLLRVLSVVMAFGFVAVVVLAWYHGEKGHQRVQGTELALLAGIVLATLGTSWYVAARTPAPDGLTSSGAPAAEGSEAALALFDPATARQSVAVLPFVNMTPDAENDYITDGITEDIISEVGKIEDLRVISRTSVQRYRNTELSIGAIGAELGVGAILEGSVRVRGDQVRIVAQLIDVATDSHIWTATYDRTFSDVFAVQTEVAREIAGALGGRLSPAVLASNDVPEVDPEAWRQYMRGRTMSNSSSDEDRRLAEAHLDSAISIAPDFAPALAALANLRTPVTLDLDTEEINASADAAVRVAERAVQLNPNLSDAHSSLAMMRALRGQDPAGAESAARQAIEANPNSVPARLRYAQILFATGRRDDAMEQARAAAALDPLSSQVHTQVAEFALSAGQVDVAKAHLGRAMDLDSLAADPHVVMASIHRREGRTDDALNELETASSMDPTDPVTTAQLASALVGAGRMDEARTMIVRLESEAKAGRPVQALIAPIYMSMGEIETAVEWVRQASEAGRRTLFMMPPRERRAFDAMLEDPRLVRRLDSLGIRIELRRDSTRAGGRRPPAPPGGRSGTPQGR